MLQTPPTRSLIAIAVAALVALVAPLEGRGQRAEARGTGRISGTVFSDASGAPIGMAYVILVGASGVLRATATDRAGRFSIADLPADRYTIGASKAPHLGAVAPPVTLADGAAATEVVVRMPMGAAVFGIVVNESGQPAPGITVSASGPRLPAPRTSTTDLRGEYRIHGLPAGLYEITAPHATDPRPVQVEHGGHHQALPLQVLPADPPPAGPPGPSATARTGRIAGQVLDVRTMRPIAGVTVALRRTTRGALTDADGRFRFTDLGAETHLLMVEHPGYSPLSSAAVPLADEAQVTDVTLRAGRHGSLAGVVRDEAGDPIVGMGVQAFRKQVLNFQPMLMPRGGTLTDDRGMFRIESLPPGDYLVTASALDPLPIDPVMLRQLGPAAPSAATVTRHIDETVLTFPPTYYPGRARGADAQVVALDYNDNRIGIDLTMYGVKPFAVTGRLTENGGPPSSTMAMSLFPEWDLVGSLSISEIQPVELSPSGAFRFAGLPPGRYSLEALPADGSSGTPPGAWASSRLTVEDRDIHGLAIALGYGSTLRGRVEFSGTSRRPDPEILATATVAIHPLELSHRFFVSLGTGNSPTRGHRLDADGHFTISDVPPGRYGVTVNVPKSPWTTVQSVVSADGAGLDGVLTVGASGVSEILVTVSDPPLAALEGTAILDRYESPAATRVVVFPIDRATWTETHRHPGRFSFEFVTPRHTFSLQALSPGEYFVALVSTFDFEMSTLHLERWSRTAQRVTLRAGETTQVALRRRPGSR